MDRESVGALYDALYDFESSRRGDGAYPVHKPLCLAGAWHEDIYDWVADRLRLGSADRVLDVGCGVGFGTIRLAERGVGSATGITVSRQELFRALQGSSRSARSGRIEFLLGTFDRLPREAFDVVVAVESLKHSDDLSITLGAILDAMVPGARAVVVEDVFVGDPGGADAQHLMRDWLLARLYTEEDYVAALNVTGRRVVDLTSAVRRRGRMALTAKLAAVNVALIWPGGPDRGALRAFRGGLHLERLYAAGSMRYKAFFFSKGDAEIR